MAFNKGGKSKEVTYKGISEELSIELESKRIDLLEIFFKQLCSMETLTYDNHILCSSNIGIPSLYAIFLINAL